MVKVNRTLLTVVLVSSRTEQAYYQREEIASAIQMAREDPTTHRVVPVFLDDPSTGQSQIPYGLRVKHGLYLSEAGNLENIAFRLLSALSKAREKIVIYDGRIRDVVFDFNGRGDSFWTGKGSEARCTSGIGEGTLTFLPGGILNIKRTNDKGRYEVRLLVNKQLASHPILPSIDARVEEPQLCFIPFSSTGYELIQEKMRMSILQNALKYGRNL